MERAIFGRRLGHFGRLRQEERSQWAFALLGECAELDEGRCARARLPGSHILGLAVAGPCDLLARKAYALSRPRKHARFDLWSKGCCYGC